MEAELLQRVLPKATAGAAVLVSVSSSQEQTSWARGSLDGDAAADRDSVMYAASVTKQMIAVLVAQEVLAGRLSPGTTVGELLDDLPNWVKSTTIDELLHHTSGLPSTESFLTAAGLPSEPELTNAAVLQGLGTLSAPDRRGGEGFLYSNVGYVVLAEVLATCTATALPDLARRRLFAPLGMTRSMLATSRHGFPASLRPPRTIGDGGLWTTAGDLATWLDGLNRGRLSLELTELVETPGRLDDGTEVPYAWGVTRRPGPRSVSFTHGGTWSRWAAKTVRSRDTGTAVAVLSLGGDPADVSEVAVKVHDRLA